MPTPEDNSYGIFKGKDNEFKVVGLGESAMAGVGICKHTLTLTGLTAVRLNELLGCNVNWRILAENGLTLKNLNRLILNEPYVNADLVIVSIGGNDVFQLTCPWIWKKNICTFVDLLFQNNKKTLILFSHLPPVGRFPAIPRPLNIFFGLWGFLLQASLAHAIDSMDNVYLLDERFPDGSEYYLEDGIHPSPLAYDLWSEKLAIRTLELLNKRNN